MVSHSLQPAADVLPRGTVTFLFTDLEGSTRLWEQAPDAARQALARHDALIEAAIGANGGHLVRPRGEGDSRFAVFARASDALAAARDIQRALSAEPWPTPSPLRVRMAIHTGEADWRDGDYYGSEVNRCARLRAVAHGGQVLLTQTTFALTRNAVPSGVELRDLGEHRLKDLERPEHVFQLVIAGLPADFPPLQSLDAVPNNLPPQLTSFVGRERELREVKALIEKERLVTLTGPGGTGKTRLALRVAGDLIGEFKHGVWFVDLSSIHEPSLVARAIAGVLGVRERGDRPTEEVLRDFLREKELLLLLDNFEQVIDAATLVKDLLLQAPGLKLIVTSRILLRIAGEQEYEVPQFALPDPAHLPPLEQLSQYEAVRLFIERARAYKSDWTITNENAPAVAEICYRLDGLPLAIELAAARVRLLPPAKMLAQLNNRLTLLKSPARDLPARQQTLSGAIDWSYDLLTPDEQRLFQRLAVFIGGATFEAAEAICNADGDLDVLSGLESLVDKSLLRQREEEDGPRLTMLETIREYAAAKLVAAPEERNTVRRAHAEYFADWTRAQWEHLTGEGREEALKRLTADIENIRAAWKYWVDERNLEQLGKFTDTLWLLNDARGWYRATADFTADLLNVLASAEPSPEVSKEQAILQLSLARALLTTKGYTPEVEQAYNRALELCEREGEIPQLFPVLRGLASFYIFRAEFAKSGVLGDRIVALADRLDDRAMRVEGLLLQGVGGGGTGDMQRAMSCLEQAIGEYNIDAQRNRRFVLSANSGVSSLTASSIFLWMFGFPDRARRRAGEAIALARKLDHPFSMAYSLYHTSLLHLWMGEAEAAKKQAEAALEVAEEHEFQVWAAVARAIRGGALAALGSHEEGLALIGRGIEEYRGLPTPPVFFPLLLYVRAEACHAARRPEEGQALIDQAAQILGGRGDSNPYASLFLNLRGMLLLQLGGEKQAEAEASFQLALEMGRALQAPTLELRAATSLCRLWREQGKAQEGRALLQPIYDRFTEGFSAPDLKEARKMLEK